MGIDFKKFIKGILLKGESADLTDNQEGSVWHNSTSNRIKSYLGGSVREVTTNDQAQTLTGKTINAPDNTVTNIEDANVSATAGIDATKLGNGDVDNTELSRLNGLTGDVQTQLDGKASTTLNNIGSTAVNADIIPDTDDTHDLGSNTNSWAQIWSKFLIVNNLSMDEKANQVGQSGQVIESNNLTQGDNITLQTFPDSTADAVATGDTYILTGNKSAGTGDSGSIIVQPGTSTGGTRGDIKFKDGSEGTTGHVWTSKGTDGEGNWQPLGTTFDIDDLNDVDTTTTAPVQGDRLQFNGTNWVPVERAHVHAYATLNPSLTSGTTQDFTFMYNAELIDVGGDFNTGTGAFTAPRNGLYHVSASYRLLVSPGPTGAASYDISIIGNGRTLTHRKVVDSDSAAFTMEIAVNGVFKLIAGQSIAVTVFQNTGSTQSIQNGSNVTFLVITEL